jgi:hypothetical protein
MEFWFNTSFNEKLQHWKQFRDEVKDDSIEDKLEKTSVFFSRIGYGKRCIDFHTPSSWPTPWELLDYKTHCLSSISLMMYNTLKFVDVELTLMVIDDGQDEYIVPYHEGTDTILNYYNGSTEKLANIVNDIKILNKINL